MHKTEDLAIVLRSVRFEERHRIVTALTQNHGQISAVAKNSIQSKRFGGTLELFTASLWMIDPPRPGSGSELYQLTEATIRKSFDELRCDFDRLAFASLLSEFMLKLSPKNVSCPDLFQLHANSLVALTEIQSREDGLRILNAYLAKLLQWSGNQPRLQFCLECKTLITRIPADTELTCLIENAGWICPDCRVVQTRHLQERSGQHLTQSLLRVSARSLLDFYISLSTPVRSIVATLSASEEEHRQLFQFIEALYIYHVPGFDQKPLKSLRFLGLDAAER